jgi:hypothetical protein
MRKLILILSLFLLSCEKVDVKQNECFVYNRCIFGGGGFGGGGAGGAW